MVMMMTMMIMTMTMIKMMMMAMMMMMTIIIIIIIIIIVTADKASFWHVFNLFVSDFGHIYSFLKGQLFRQYCGSFYGGPLWYLKSDGVETIYVAW